MSSPASACVRPEQTAQICAAQLICSSHCHGAAALQIHSEAQALPAGITALPLSCCRAVQQALLTAAWPAALLTHPMACINTGKITVTSQTHAQYLQPSDVLFRGLRVRMGVASGVVERVHVHEVTKRVEFSGRVMELVSSRDVWQGCFHLLLFNPVRSWRKRTRLGHICRGWKSCMELVSRVELLHDVTQQVDFSR